MLVQYNISVHNAGGFVEIPGDNRNTAYRYNVIAVSAALSSISTSRC